MPAQISLDDIPPDQRRKLGLAKPRERKFSQEEVRSWALKILAAMAGLTRDSAIVSCATQPRSTSCRSDLPA